MNAPLQVSLPDLIPEPKTAKQKLKNDIIGFLRERDCQWQVAEVTSSGNSLVFDDIHFSHDMKHAKL